MRHLRLAAMLSILTLVLGAGGGISVPAQEIVFTSNQFTPVVEQEWARNTLLAKFTQDTGIQVRFITEAEGTYVDRLLAEARAGRGTIGVTGTLHGIFPVGTGGQLGPGVRSSIEAGTQTNLPQMKI